jgi:hypothetical protein
MKLFGDRTTANDLAPFKHNDFESSLGKVTGRYQPVVPSSDYNCVKCH